MEVRVKASPVKNNLRNTFVNQFEILRSKGNIKHNNWTSLSINTITLPGKVIISNEQHMLQYWQEMVACDGVLSNALYHFEYLIRITEVKIQR